jgi:FlaA1/EpsC-like NDP-sugar epimerase
LGAVLLWVAALKIGVLYAFGQFEDSLSYFSTPDLKRILGVCVASACFVAFGYEYVAMPWAPPRSVVLIDALLGGLILCSGRLGIRFFRERFLTPQTRAR